ncbi:hypothetical protein RF11_13822 [Thelohanellus kitauei]|uniref:Uncharacterized protein n=1 Tax=Thelohanellus kitauei TaxID=669202 RepID=A0A0C2MLE6_THEKT|nr:hypothetical protein RF11_13822 [Thelohanellus kitauei]
MNRHKSRLAAPTNFDLLTNIKTTESSIFYRQESPGLKPPTRLSLPSEIKPIPAISTANHQSPRPQGLSLHIQEPVQRQTVLPDELHATTQVNATINNKSPVLCRKNHTLPKTLAEVLKPSDTLLSPKMIDELILSKDSDKPSEEKGTQVVTPITPPENIVPRKLAEISHQSIHVEETVVIEQLDNPTDDRRNDSTLEDYDQLPHLDHGFVVPTTSEPVFEHSQIQLRAPSPQPSLLKPSIFKSIENKIQPETLRFYVDLLNPHSDWILEAE